MDPDGLNRIEKSISSNDQTRLVYRKHEPS